MQTQCQEEATAARLALQDISEWAEPSTVTEVRVQAAPLGAGSTLQSHFLIYVLVK